MVFCKGFVGFSSFLLRFLKGLLGFLGVFCVYVKGFLGFCRFFMAFQGFCCRALQDFVGVLQGLV